MWTASQVKDVSEFKKEKKTWKGEGELGNERIEEKGAGGDEKER